MGRLAWLAAASALALVACGAGGESGRPAADEGSGRAAAESPESHASLTTPGDPSAADGTATHDAGSNGVSASGAPANGAASSDRTGREARRAGRSANGAGSAPGRTAMQIAVPPRPPAPAPAASPIPDAPPPPMPPPPPELSPEEAIAAASVPPVGGEVGSLVTCGDVARAYGELMETNRSCGGDEDCRVLEGSCEIGLGGCWYAVHRSVGYDDADRLAARYRDLACGGPVCRCAGAPAQAICRQGVCTAAG